MFTVDIILKYTPMPMSVQRKSAEDAEATFHQILAQMGSEQKQILELTCDKMPEKKIAVLSSEISAIQISQKSGATATGKTPGFVN